MRQAIRACALAAGLVTTAATGASGQGVATFFEDKTINIIVAANAGGGYDLYARLLARHMSKHIPGHPSFSVQNQPGGGGIVAANNIYGVARPDGLSMALLASSNFLYAALGDAASKFDTRKFTFIGNMNEEVDTCSVWRTSGVKSLDDAMRRDVVIGTTGVASNSHTFPTAMNEVIGTRFKTVLGYSGPGRVVSMERGEIEGACGIFVSTLRSQFETQVSSGDMRIIVQMGFSRHPALKDVPNALELARDDAGRQLLELLFAQLALGRPVLAPPGVPADRAKALQDAFNATMVDPQFIADADKANIEQRWFDAGRMRAVMAKMDSAPESVRAPARLILGVKD